MSKDAADTEEHTFVYSTRSYKLATVKADSADVAWAKASKRHRVGFLWNKHGMAWSESSSGGAVRMPPADCTAAEFAEKLADAVKS